MDSTPTLLKPPPAPPFPAPSQTFDISPLEFILALFAVILIPTLIYTFFLFLKCPPNPFRHRPSRSSGGVAEELTRSDEIKDNMEVVSGVTVVKETHVKDIGSECPVCLSAFADGEKVQLLITCKHSFHASCIDKWLNSHSNCPVCRASVPVKRSSDNTSLAREVDLGQGLPDSASLV